MRAVIYTRVSTVEQAREGYSLAAQRKALEELARIHSYDIVSVYEDAGISAKDVNHRPAMMQMLADIGGYDVILVFALSRLTRSVSDLYNTLEVLRKHDVTLISRTEAFDTSTPTGRAMVGLLGVFAQLERELTSERVRAAMAERAAQGKRTCSEVLGYDIDGADGLVINPAEAEVVRYIYDAYLRHQCLSAVAELCEARGYRGKRGRVFKASHIKTILSRPIYIGYNSYHGQLYKGTHEPIVSEAQYNKVQRLLGKGRKGEGT